LAFLPLLEPRILAGVGYLPTVALIDRLVRGAYVTQLTRWPCSLRSPGWSRSPWSATRRRTSAARVAASCSFGPGTIALGARTGSRTHLQGAADTGPAQVAAWGKRPVHLEDEPVRIIEHIHVVVNAW